MFSRRTAFGRDINAVARRLDQLRADARPLIDLTESNPTAVGLSLPPPVLLGALCSGDLSRYEPDPRGLLSAREALARFLSARGPAVEAGDLLLTASTSEAYGYLFKLLCEPGDEVLVPHPAYPLFEYLAGLDAVALREYPVHYDGEWHLSVEDIAAAGGERTRAVLVVSPGNPTGAYLKRGELEVLADLCAERGWALISDEVFADFPVDPPPSNRVLRAATHDARALTFSLSGLSKVAALPQLKVGWMVVAGPRALRDEAMARLELVADTYLSVNAPAQAALPQLLDHVPELQARVRERLRLNRERLVAFRAADAAWSVLSAEGGWMATLRLPVRVTEEEVCLRLLDEGVIVHPGYFFDFAASCYLVLSLLPEEGVFAEGARRVARVLNAL